MILSLFSLFYPLFRGRVLAQLLHHHDIVVVKRNKNSKFYVDGVHVRPPKYMLARVIKKTYDRPRRVLVDLLFTSTREYINREDRLTYVLRRGWYLVDNAFMDKVCALPDSYNYGYKHIHGREFAETPGLTTI